MAWYYGTFICEHEGRVNIVGPIKDRQRKADNKFSRLCPECYAKYLEEERQKKNLEAAEAAKEMELPELEGTQKQVDWANAIRVDFINKLSSIKEDPTSFKKTLMYDLPKAEIIEVINSIDDITEELINKSKAHFFIDNRDNFIETVNATYKEILIKRDKEKNTADEVILESVVSPVEIKYAGVVTIEFDDNIVRAYFEKNYDFIDIAKGLKFRWQGKYWYRKISESNGEASDRAAELGSKLLNKGFSICIIDEETRNKAINAEYELECTRWIYKRKGTAKLLLSWDHNDDLYTKASKLPGAKWDSPGILVDVSHYQDIEEFAELMGFKFSKAAKNLIESYKKELLKVPLIEVSDSKEYVDKNGLEDILNSSRDIIEDLKED